jgi:hypothetical protein
LGLSLHVLLPTLLLDLLAAVVRTGAFLPLLDLLLSRLGLPLPPLGLRLLRCRSGRRRRRLPHLFYFFVAAAPLSARVRPGRHDQARRHHTRDTEPLDISVIHRFPLM